MKIDPERSGIRVEARNLAERDLAHLAVRVPPALISRLRHAALQRDTTVQALLAEIVTEALPHDLAVMKVGDNGKPTKR